MLTIISFIVLKTFKHKRWFYANRKAYANFNNLDTTVTENSKTWNKKARRKIFLALLAPLAASIVQPEISSAVKCTIGRGVRRAGRGYMNKIV